jgi:hypothetical protein
MAFKLTEKQLHSLFTVDVGFSTSIGSKVWLSRCQTDEVQLSEESGPTSVWLMPRQFYPIQSTYPTDQNSSSLWYQKR